MLRTSNFSLFCCVTFATVVYHLSLYHFPGRFYHTFNDLTNGRSLETSLKVAIELKSYKTKTAKQFDLMRNYRWNSIKCAEWDTFSHTDNFQCYTKMCVSCVPSDLSTFKHTSRMKSISTSNLFLFTSSYRYLMVQYHKQLVTLKHFNIK